ncbi:unnamed protein product [Brassica napus]|uniref:(rape) hypothetical protein n=1 Tax=Brassica napus TaxID=3708 RepID=A0A816PIG6_BRANA|nr:unnamed protein product [Brassica napus]
MADQNDPHSDTPTEEATRLPLKKRGYAEKTLPGLNNNNDDSFFPIDNKDMDLNKLKENAYYEVLKAFLAESSTISGVNAYYEPRIMFMKELKKELNIDHDTHADCHKRVKTDTLVQELRGTSSEKATEKATDAEEEKSTSAEGEALKPRLVVDERYVLKLQESFNVAPAKIQQETAQPSDTSTPAKIQKDKAEVSATTTTTPEELPFPSWGHVAPESLVNSIINIIIYGDNDHVQFQIKAYDAETEMHQLVTLGSTKEHDDPLDWIDIRYFPKEDVIWQNQHPGFTTRNCLLKPGQTILNATTTAREKTPIKVVGTSASGIPIIKIKKLDKGKAKAQ